jgi:hypothetical protein
MKSKKSYINFKEMYPFVGALNILWCEGSMLFSSEIPGNHHPQQIYFSWRPHMDYVVAKVKVATMALYPLLGSKSTLSL